MSWLCFVAAPFRRESRRTGWQVVFARSALTSSSICCASLVAPGTGVVLGAGVVRGGASLQAAMAAVDRIAERGR
jgi:hypothetical protein